MKRLLTIIFFLCLICQFGCVKTYYRNIDGVSASVAVSLPDEDYIKIQMVEYISGNKTIVKEPAKIKQNYKTYSTNEYLWGAIKICERRENDIVVIPTNSLDKVEGK